MTTACPYCGPIRQAIAYEARKAAKADTNGLHEEVTRRVAEIQRLKGRIVACDIHGGQS